MRWYDIKDKKIKELIFYGVILFAIILIVVCNNIFWKIGKETKQEISNNNTQMQLLEINNITYNVPYEEEWLD